MSIIKLVLLSEERSKDEINKFLLSFCWILQISGIRYFFLKPKFCYEIKGKEICRTQSFGKNT